MAKSKPPAPEPAPPAPATSKVVEASAPRPVSDLKPDPANRRRHPPRNLQMVTDSLKSIGTARSIVIDEDDIVLAGNGVVQAAQGAGIANVRVIDVEGDELIAIRRTGLTPEQKRQLAMFDNRTAELAEWNVEQLGADVVAGLDLKPFWTEAELTALSRSGAETKVLELGANNEDRGDKDSDMKALGPDFSQFTCALTLEQERLVRSALRTAKAVFGVDTTGNALTAALQDWLARARDAADGAAAGAPAS